MAEEQQKPAGEEKPAYTPEMEELAASIKTKSNFYDILGVEKDATEDQLKKAYRKLALRVHPDKNRAPSAQEAFKKVGTAYATLSDASKRRHYDMFGTEMNSGGGPNFQDINPEELFKQFFGGGGIEEIFAQAFGAQMGGMGRGRGGGGAHPFEQMFAQAMSGGMGGGGRGRGGGGPRMHQMGPGVFSMSFGGPMGGGGGMNFGGFPGAQFQQFQTGPQHRRRGQQQFREAEEETKNLEGESNQEQEQRDADDLRDAFMQGFGRGHQAGAPGGQANDTQKEIERQLKMLCMKCCAGCFLFIFVLPYVAAAMIRAFFALFGIGL